MSDQSSYDWKAHLSGQQPFGWAGWLLHVPKTLRPIRIKGDAKSGTVVLGDQGNRSLQMMWATVTRHRFDSNRFARRRLRCSVGGKRKIDDTAIDTVDHTQFETLLHYQDEAAGLHRYVGYVQATRRVIEIAWRDVDDRQTALSRSIREMSDQPTDGPQRWAFFSVSFVAPTGFVYHESTLNMGDMGVSLVRAGRGHGELTMRHIYPAGLALTRGDLTYWLFAQLDAVSTIYIRSGPRGGRWRDAERIDTTIGPGLMCDAVRRVGQRLISPHRPRTTRIWVIHDTHHDRLIAMRLADEPAHFNKLFEELIANLHWASTSASSPK